jgi:hypothetical protein
VIPISRYAFSLANEGPAASVAGQAVSWLASGVGSIVVSDAKTDSQGKARAIVRSFEDGVQDVEAWIGSPGAVCEPSAGACDAVEIEWTKDYAECGGSAYAAALAHGGSPDRYAEFEDELIRCGDGDHQEATERDLPIARLLTSTFDVDGDVTVVSRAAEVSVALPGQEPLETPAGSVAVTTRPLVIDVGEATARSYCSHEYHYPSLTLRGAQELDASSVKIRDASTDEVLYDDDPAPNTVVEIPGVARLVLNEQESSESGLSASGAVTAAHVFLPGGSEVEVGHAESRIRCVEFDYDTILAVLGDAHGDHATGPVHLSLEVYGTGPNGGTPPFVRAKPQYTDGQKDPNGTQSVPFTCYDAAPTTLTAIPPLLGGYARARLAGTITCWNFLASGATSRRFTLEIEDISPYLAPDFYWMKLLDSTGATTLYDMSEFTTEGSLTVGQY